MSAGEYLAPVVKPSYENGYSLKYALRHPRKTPHRLPNGWRWLTVGEYTRVRDVACDPRIAPVQILVAGACVTATHLPIRRKAA